MVSPTDIRLEIENGPLASEIAEHILSGNHQAIADILNRKDHAVVIFPRHVNHLSMMAEIDSNVAATILDKLEAASSTFSTVKWALYSIKSESGIDVGHPSTRNQIDALVAAGILTSSEGNAIKAMAERMGSRAEVLWGIDTVISHEQVAEALR